MDYSLNAGEWNKVFAVPSAVVDKYIKLASGNALKLLLFLTRHGGETFTAEILRAELGFEEPGELEDAALFWVQRGVISAQNTKSASKLLPAAAKAPEPQNVPNGGDLAAVKEKPAAKRVEPVVISNGEIAQTIKSSPEMQMLFSEAEKMYARPLRDSERQTIIRLNVHYGLPCEVALMLLGYCFKIGKATAAYITKVAEDWSNDEITTVRLADEKIRVLEKQDSIEQRICRAMGLTSKPSSKMRGFIKTWVDDWGFGEDMIMLAYDKTIDGTGEWNAPYANRILERWKETGITTPVQAEKADEDFKNSKAKKPPAASKKQNAAAAEKKSSFDTDKLRSRIMSGYKNND